MCFLVSPHSGELLGEMGETCYCFTSRTSLTRCRVTHLTADATHGTQYIGEAKCWKEVELDRFLHRLSCIPSGILFLNSFLFGILLEIEIGGWGECGGAWNYNPSQKTKACLCLLCLMQDPFHLYPSFVFVFSRLNQKWNTCFTTQTTHLCADLIKNMERILSLSLWDMGISYQNLQM